MLPPGWLIGVAASTCAVSTNSRSVGSTLKLAMAASRFEL
jgi:hypothetical protein